MGRDSIGLYSEGLSVLIKAHVLRYLDEDITYEFDQTLKRGDGYIPSMQGILKNLVETTCTVQDASGEFVITKEILDQALTYAKQHNAKGAIFYLNRTTKTARNSTSA